ncbi:MAG: PTPA-CTERM sorting domain-containing protein [Nodosilinea sp.]
MKERLIGVGLGVGVALTLGLGWASSAQAFALRSSVTATNSIRDVNTQEEAIFVDPLNPQTVTVGPQLELKQFGGVWNIDFDDNSILFSINSRFGNVASGDDIYRFLTPNLGGRRQKTLVGFTAASVGIASFDITPEVDVLAGNWLEVVFPQRFFEAGGLNSIPNGNLAFRIDLMVEDATAVPTPALLPGLVGMGLAALRKGRQDRAD